MKSRDDRTSQQRLSTASSQYAAPPAVHDTAVAKLARAAKKRVLDNALNQSSLKAGERAVGRAILQHMQDLAEGAFPGIKRLSKVTGFCPRTVRTHIASLVRAGWLKIVKRRGTNGRHCSNHYYLTIPSQGSQGQNLPLAHGQNFPHPEADFALSHGQNLPPNYQEELSTELAHAPAEWILIEGRGVNARWFRDWLDELQKRGERSLRDRAEAAGRMWVNKLSPGLPGPTHLPTIPNIDEEAA